jgi:hypothetical protein
VPGSLGININDMTTDSVGDIYISEFRRIRKINPGTGVISNVAGNGEAGPSGDGGPATAAAISPFGLAIDSSDNLFVVQFQTSTPIRRIDLKTGLITSVGGLNVLGGFRAGLAIDRSDNLVVFDTDSRAYRVNWRTGAVTSTLFGAIRPFAIDPLDRLYGGLLGSPIMTVTQIARVSALGVPTVVAGTQTRGFSGDGGPATAAGMEPTDIAFDREGNLFIADWNRRIRVVRGPIP